jgi:hypothetical protein
LTARLSDNLITLNWNPPAAVVTNYVVYRSIDGSTYVAIATLGGTQTRFVTQRPGTVPRAVYYRVRAKQNGAFSAYSNTAGVSLPR